MSTTAPVAPTWAEVDRGFFVASTDGLFLGSVDRTSQGRYLARDGQAAQIGTFDTFAAAQRAVLEHML
jgi:hypothetical protein